MKSAIISADNSARFVCEENCQNGILRVAKKVIGDIEKVFDFTPEIVKQNDLSRLFDGDLATFVFGEVGNSSLLDQLESEGRIDLGEVRGKREVFGFFVLDGGVIVIAGSDRLGTVYGLFHISELIGVSPLVDWSAVNPAKLDSFTFEKSMTFVSKEPSVRYRGFFINDEWPAFGNWCKNNFGGINAKMYDHVFELLLRMKGNYLWPAMWSSCFALDGPDLASAELADEYGIIMGTSHHEPCLRHGEEYRKVRGKDSPYGDAWDFRRNREGITRFWRDGLRRNGHLRNIITVGMRGEADSAILGRDATLKDNIDLLRDVLKTQNQLIREEVNADLDKVPRMLALYKEVEPYYYGDSSTEGLMNDPELDGVILMLCDDNHGYLRSLPDEAMRSHKGGFGMYYHFDYHGGPISYEWINSSYLPEVWEQMTACYEHGVDQLWIVNVGDLGLQEMPLSYFMDLAYDYDKWGISAPNSTDEYMKQWMSKQFGSLAEEDIARLAGMYTDYTRIIHNRRPEHLNDKVYAVRGREADILLNERIPEIRKTCGEIREKLPEELRGAYTELVDYNVLGGMNLLELWLCKAYNAELARMGAVAANGYADRISSCLKRDTFLRDKLHTAADGKWNGFGLAQHIGFRSWNSEESRVPTIETVIPVDRDELIVGLCNEQGETCGLDWTRIPLNITKFYDLADPDGHHVRGAEIFTALSGCRPIEYSITVSKPWLKPDSISGRVSDKEPLRRHMLVLDEKKLLAEQPDEKIAQGEAEVTVTYPIGRVTIKVMAQAVRKPDKKASVFTEENGIISIYADHCAENVPSDKARFVLLDKLARDGSAYRREPLLADVSGTDDAPYLEYAFNAAEDGSFRLIFTLQPNNSYRFGKGVEIAFSLNGEEPVTLDVLPENYEAGMTYEWAMGVLDHARYVSTVVKLSKGINRLRFYGISAEAVLEKITLVRDGTEPDKSYFGATESLRF